MFKKLFLFLCFICALFMQINYGNAIGIDDINDSNVDIFIKDREKEIDKIYEDGKNFFSYDNLNNCINDVLVNIKTYRGYIDEKSSKLFKENKNKLKELMSKEEILNDYCRQNLVIITGASDGSGFSSNGMLRGMCFFLSILRSNYAKTVAALFVIGLGFLMLFGNLKFTSYMFFVIALALTFGADQVANVISGNTFSCKYINTSYKTAGEIKCPTGSYYKNGRCAFNVCSGLVEAYLDMNFNTTTMSVKNGEKIYKKCGDVRYGYIEYICKDGELDYNLDNCTEPKNNCTVRNLPRISGANFNLSGMIIDANTIVEGTCANGYLGTPKIVCQMNRSWKVESTCKVDTSKYCNTSNIYGDLGGLNKIDSKHIKLNVSKVTQEQPTDLGKTDKNISVSCDAGYEGNVSILCGTDKKWVINGTCTIIRCSTEYSLDNGKYNITDRNNMYKSEITGTCNTGYVGTPKAVCGADGNWGTLSGSCTLDKNFCPALSVKNGIVEEDRNNKRGLGTYAVLKCNKGYELSGKSALICTKDRTWDGEFGKCELSPNYCKEIDFISGADKIEYIDGNRALGSRIKITCKDGYMLKNNNILTCSDDKIWGLTSGICELISCSNLTLAENIGEWYGNMATKGQEIQGICKKGYIGKPKAICNGNGQWDIYNNCAIDMRYCSLLSVADGIVKYSDERAINSKATLTCDTGYELLGNSSVICDANKEGLWSDKIGSCPKVRCPTSLALNNGKYTITNENNKFGDKIVGKCDLGYVGEPVATCNADKTWSTTGSCKLVVCNGLDKVNPYSKYNTTTTRYGVPVKGTCEIGYKGSPVANCQENSTWSIENDCQLDTKFCDEINAVRGAYIAYEGNIRALGSKATLTCGTGFQLVGNNVSTCSESRKWQAEIGTCQLITNFCKQFNTVNGGTIKYTENQAFNSTASLKCNIGYGLKGDGEAVCMSNREWDNELGVCEPEKNWCLPIEEIANGVISYSHSNDRDSVATLKCNTGYVISGNTTTNCGENKKWSKTLGTCKLIEKYCPTLETISNGTITYLDVDRLAYNSNVQLKCDTGYSLSGSSFAKCLADKTWSELGTCEIVRCSTANLTAENGTYPKITTENNTYNTTIIGKCNNGYKGSLRAVCDENGNWILGGVCDTVVCENLDTINSHSTIWNITEISYQKSVYGTCKAGYEGEPRAVCGVDTTSGSPIGKWNIVKQCDKIMKFCPILDDEYGTYNYSEEQALDSKATLTCNVGYELINLGTTVCQADKTWTNSIKCKIKVCQDLTKQGHIDSWTATKANWDTTVNGICATGYRGSPTAKCLDNKTWEIKDNCVLKNCSNPILQNHTASWDETTTDFNTTITGKCEVGYKGVPTAKCVDQDEWEYDNNCQIMTCSNLEILGKVKSWGKTTTTYGTPIYGTCLEGYEGKPQASCNAEEKWKIIDNCKPKVCSNPEKQEGIGSWLETSTTFSQEVAGVCAEGYEGTVTATCKADQTWDIKNNCNKIKNYCPEITARNGSITYTDDQSINSTAKLTCSGKYNTSIGEKEVKCISGRKWDKELGDCGVVIQFYSPRNNAVKEKTIKKGETFKCEKVVFTENDPEPFVMKLCRVKGSDKYFGFESDGATYTLNDELFTKQSSACHIGYVNRDLNTDKLKKDYGLNGETKLYNGTLVYDAGDNSGGLRQNGGKYIINCIDGYAGKPEIVCNNGKWTWTPDKDNKTDNQCYKGGCDVTDYAQSSKNLVDAGWGLETKGCSVERDTTRKIIPNGSWASAECKNGYISNFDNPVCDTDLAIKRQKSVFGKCVDGNIEHKPTGSSQHGSVCVRGCIYGDTDMGWTDEMFKNTTDKYYQHDPVGWKPADVGEYAFRLTSNKNALLAKDCSVGYVPGGTGTLGLSYPLVQCNYDSGKWSQHKTEVGDYYMGCEILSGCKEFAYTGGQQSFTVPSTGYANVKMQVWGAQGGSSGGNGGNGGYGYGKISSISGDTSINIIVGQAGWHGGGSNPYGAGYGGKVDGGCGSSRGKGGSGGGGTKVWFGNLILQAGGGGGSGEAGRHHGGAGGGANESGKEGTGSGGLGQPGTVNGPGKRGSTRYCNNGDDYGNGGNTKRDTAGGTYCGGAGGGGYYGGSSGEYGKEKYGGGGGGSGYARGFSNVVGGQGIKTGNGFVRMCWGDNTSCDGAKTEFSSKCD